jgi:bifunctional enzyme CysN/CysC
LSGGGATVWLTGLPGAGKTTVADAVAHGLSEAGYATYRLDGDVLRSTLNADLGFDLVSRQENVRRAAHLACTLADAGILAVVSLISPYRAGRAQARALHEATGLPFLEVYLDTPLEECERRDPRGLYARARRGEIIGMTGIDDPYEPPETPELVVHPDRQSIAEVTGEVFEAVVALDLSRALRVAPSPAPSGPRADGR